MQAAGTYPELRRRTSFGLRKGHSCAEVPLILRHLLERRREWGLPTTVVKLDVAKAYYTVSYASISALFRKRGMLELLANCFPAGVTLDREGCAAERPPGVPAAGFNTAM